MAGLIEVTFVDELSTQIMSTVADTRVVNVYWVFCFEREKLQELLDLYSIPQKTLRLNKTKYFDKEKDTV